MKKTNYFIFIVCAGLFTACKPEIIAPETNTGEIDASIYVAIGSNGTAGYSDDALHHQGQNYSYAAILSEQLNRVTESPFNQPFLLESSVGINLFDQSRLTLGYKTDCKGVTSLSPVRFAANGDLSVFGTSAYSGVPFNNMGVPDLSIVNVNTTGYGNPANGVGNYNRYFARMASSQAGSSVLSDATMQNATFFTIALGEDDIMAYAQSGGTSALPAPVNGAAGVGFDGSLSEVINAMNANGAKGAISNVPDVTAYPYFTTIPYDGLTLDADKAETMNNVFNPLGFSFQVGANPFVIEDAAQPFGVRKMEPGELILLSIPLDSVKCFGMGSIVPIPNKYILTLNEIAVIQSRVTGYNSVIENLATAEGLALVDAHSLMATLKAGIVYNGVSMSTRFITGGAFSLDGRNLNPRGHALLANTYIKSINLKFNAKIPLANVSGYSGILFP